MVIFIQFPFCDLRNFVVDSGKLSQPNWPSPISHKNFVKYSGQVITRKAGGISGWLGEDAICRVDNAIKFKKKFPIPAQSSHMFHDGNAVTKYEFVFTVNEKFSSQEDIIDALLEKELSIRIGKHEKKTTKLFRIIPDLKKLYVNSTSSSTMTDGSMFKFIKPCVPEIFLYSTNPGNHMRHGRIIPLKEGMNSYLTHRWYSYAKKPIRVFYLYHDQYELSNTLARELRITLQRLHTEYECLKNAVSFIADGKFNFKKGSIESEKLQYYINAATKRITSKRKNLSKYDLKTEIDAFSKYSFEIISPGQYDSLIQNVERLQLRKNIAQKVNDHLKDLMNKQNILIMEGDQYHINQAGAVGPNSTASNISFNQIWNQNKEHIDLKQLTGELAKLRQQLKDRAEEPEHDVMIGEIASAEAAAERGEGSSVMKHLANAGKWTLDVAKKIGVTVAAAAIKTALGI